MTLSRKLIPDLVAVQAFECAARHASFTRAGRELNLTQSAVSRQVKELERFLGTLLFERIRQRVVLSEDGRRFLPEARKLLQQTEETMLRAMSSADAASSLSIATLPTFGSRWLSPRLPDFLRRHPGVILNVGSRSTPFDFEDENFDMAIHYGQPVWARGTCTYLCSESILPVASGALAKEAGDMAPADLLEKPLLHLATRPKLWSRWFEHVGLPTERACRGHRFDQFSMIIEATIAGMGYALLPRYLIDRELASGKLAVMVDKPITTENSYYAVVPESGRTNELAQRFTAWLIGQVAGTA
ncbi:LysR family transcriptional regulator [Mesorhizobium sp. B2-7-1]|uniref:LysR family transcriptional regulator n=1 Tax=Mesorhizobium sp. B2-7-1 TaxID=2589909 RepID=UPI00112ED736|nr:LysR family transcriptional regulator [Mesorhizobium sp. B2-7-1]TPJ74596.1 LysR family transcriptional regulator [Mesorhizobium sp. B2-7-1]